MHKTSSVGHVTNEFQMGPTVATVTLITVTTYIAVKISV